MDSEVSLVETILDHVAASKLNASKISYGIILKMFEFINCEVLSHFGQFSITKSTISVLQLWELRLLCSELPAHRHSCHGHLLFKHP